MGLLDDAIRGCDIGSGGIGKKAALDVEAPRSHRPDAITTGVILGGSRLDSSAATSAWLGNMCRFRGTNADVGTFTVGGGCTGSAFDGISASAPHAIVGSAGKKLRRVLVEDLIGPSGSTFGDGPGMGDASTMDDVESTPRTARGDGRFTAGDSGRVASIAPRRTGRG